MYHPHHLQFTGTYVVPGTPERSDCTLYFFIGLENYFELNVNILQPVLRYQDSFWSYTSWICCPSNISTTGNRVLTSEHATLTGGIERKDSNTWDVYGYNENGQKTNLQQRVGSFKYNWACVTMESYYYIGCNQSPKGPITFKDMKIYNARVTEITPAWRRGTGETMCNGHLNISSPSEITDVKNIFIPFI